MLSKKGDFKGAAEKFEEALTYLDEALKIHGDLNDKKGEAQDWRSPFSCV